MQVPFWFVTFGSGGGLRKRDVIAGLVLAACVGSPAPSRAQQGLSHAEEPVLSKDPTQRIDQDKPLSGDYSLRQVSRTAATCSPPPDGALPCRTRAPERAQGA